MTSSVDIASPRSRFYASLLWNIGIDALCPYLVYRFVSPHTSQPAALCWTMLPPALSNVFTLVRKRHLDIVGMIVILGTVAGLALFFLGGSPRLLLVRESFITGLIGVAFLASLMAPKPLSYYIARQFVTNNDRERAASWDDHYCKSRYKFGMPTITAVWGLVLVGEAILRTVLAMSLSISTFLAVYNFLSIAIYAIAMAWSYSFGGRMYQRESFSALAVQN